jgi:hypothetical protein
MIANTIMTLGGSFDVKTAGSEAVAADGQKFVILENSGVRIPQALTLIENWQAVLRK